MAHIPIKIATDSMDPGTLFRSMVARTQGSAPMIEIDLATAIDQSRTAAAHIISDWQTLQAILDRHQCTIHNRWAKKTRAQRIDVLLAAWPNMPASHRPDFDALRLESLGERLRGTKFRDAYLWPHINIEDLTKPRILPLFLDSRAQRRPDEFAIADEHTYNLGRVSKAIPPRGVCSHVMMLACHPTPETYGEIIGWNDPENRATAGLMSGEAIDLESGMLILEVQQRLYRFLVDFCRRILHDIPATALTSNAYSLQQRFAPPPPTVNGFESLAIMAAEAPYRPPVDMDLARLESLFTAKASAAEDHIWALREDPGYFADVMLEAKAHRVEMVRDEKGRAHPFLATGRQHKLWERVMGNAVIYCHIELEFWSELLSQVKYLKLLHARFCAEDSTRGDLPEVYLDALLRFRLHLHQGSQKPLYDLRDSMVGSAAMRSYFVRHSSSKLDENPITSRTECTKKLDKAQEQLLRLLHMFLSKDDQLSLIGLPDAVDQIDRLIQGESTAKAMMSSLNISLLGDLTAFAEGMRQVDLYQRSSQVYHRQYMTENIDRAAKEYDVRTEGWARVKESLDDMAQRARLARLGAPDDSRFYYPVGKRRTMENVNAMRAAEQNLDKFWSTVDQIFREGVGDQLERMELRGFLVDPKPLRRTPPWIEPEKGQGTSPAAKDLTGANIVFSELYLNVDRSQYLTTGRKILKENEPVIKNKSRGEAMIGRIADPATVITNAPLNDHSAIAVDARALKVFHTLFFTPSISATPGEVAWTEFLHAMHSTGFIPEKLYGSVWQFAPTKLDVERSIQFHEPHPACKLPYKTARRFGRRLERAYGWTSSTFVLKEKGPQAQISGDD